MLSTPADRRYVKSRRQGALALLLAGSFLAASMPPALRAAEPVAPVVAAPLAGAPAATAIPRPPELQRDVDFWIRVYSEITTNEGFLHDEWDLSIVYAKLQFPPNTDPEVRREAVDSARDRYVAALKEAAAVLSSRVPGTAANDAALGEDVRRVIAIWGAAASPERLLEAARSVRFQLGQADRFRAGLVRSAAWETHIAEAFANLGLPPELAALPHVESSFTPNAYSKVGAAGLWQFMRSTGRRYMRVDDVVDERLDPFRSTEAAAQLLAYNYRVLGSWPLALTAYNHGAAGMRRAKEAMGTEDFVTIARRYRSATFGFASRNFFPSFLAALTIDQNPEKYFGAIERAPEIRFREVAMPGYARVAVVERAVDVSRATLRELNPALRGPIWDGTRLVPRGYRLRLPPGPAELNTESLAARIGANELYAAQIEQRSHRVRNGDSLATVARRYGVSTRTLAELNGVEAGVRLRRGRVLRLPETRPPLLASAGAKTPAADAGAAAAIPVVASAATPAAAIVASRAVAAAGTGSATVASSAGTAASSGGAAAGSVAAANRGGAAADEAPATTPRSYVVRAGDTLFGVAAKFGLTPRQLMALNRIRDADFIFEGQRLRVSGEVEAMTASAVAADVASAEEVAEEAADTGGGPSAAGGAGGSARSGRGGATPPAPATPAAVAAVAAARTASEEVALVASSRQGPSTRRAARAAGAPLVLAEAPTRGNEPVTADAQGPEVGPGAGSPPPLADAIDLAVRDGSVRVIAEETLGHYADWLGVSAARLREINKMKYGQAVLLGKTLKLDFSRGTQEQFEQKRRDFHARLQAAFFAQRRILGTEVYIVRRGDTLWSITQRYAGVPVWLLQQYNPDLELGALRTGVQLVVPRLEDVQAGVVAGR